MEFDNFLSNNNHFCKSALSRYTAWDFIDLVKRHGIDFEERKHNQLFCLHSAKDIVKMLLDECEEKGVKIIKTCASRIKNYSDIGLFNVHLIVELFR